MSSTQSQNSTILVVDDEPTILKVCRQILELGGYTVVTAGSAIEALQFLQGKNNRIDLALIDVMMPGMTGIELSRRMESAELKIPILLMSGFRPHEVARVVGAENPYRIIWKPFNAESLLRMIANALLSDSADAASL